MMIVIMIRYIIRLDDASEIMNVSTWERIEELLDNLNTHNLQVTI